MKTRIALMGALGLVVLAGGMPQEPKGDQGPAKRVGEKIGRAIDEVKEGARDVAGGVRQRLAQARAAVDNMGVEARIYGRLHWDKALADVAFDLEVREGGVAILRGTVPDAPAKAKALSLAGDTVGVSRVVDELSVAPAQTKSTTRTEVKTSRPRP